MDQSNPADIPFQSVMEALLNTEKPFTPRFLYRFSDLDQHDLDQLKEIWPDIPNWRRKALIEDIEQLGEDDTLLSFETIGQFALSDSDPAVRLPAIGILWEYENPALIDAFLKMVESDPSSEVRSAAASALGKFVYMGELEEIPAHVLKKIEDRLLSVLNGSDEAVVRRNALESLGYSSRKEIPGLIETAFQSGEKEWMASALNAMGRSANSRWKPQVLSMLDSPLPTLRAEAARAAGELEIGSAASRLLELLDDPDEPTRLASIWSLSQLGGEGVRTTLERIYDETDDDHERAYLESALDNLSFNENMELIPLLDLSETPTNTPERLNEEYEQYFAEAFTEDFDDEYDLDLEDDSPDEQDWYDNEEDLEGDDEDMDV